MEFSQKLQELRRQKGLTQEQLAAALLFVIGLQPYAAVLLLVFLSIKVLLIIKKR